MPSRVIIPTIPGASFRLPPQLEGLRALAYNLYWAWHPRTRVIWSRIDRRVWNRHRNPIPVLAGPVDWTRLLDDASFMVEVRELLRDFDRYLENGSDRWFVRHHADELPGPVAYFCAEYGLYESLGIYSGGLGVLAGDHMKTTSRHGPAVRRRRVDVPPGLLPPDDRRRRPPGARLPRLRPEPAARRARPGPGRRAADGQHRPAGARPPDRGLGRPGRADTRPPARHRHPRERRRRPADHPHPVRSRPRDASPSGARPRRRRGPGAAGARDRPCGLAPERGPLRVPPRRAGARVRRHRDRARDRLGSGPPRQRLHDPHPGLGRQRALCRRARPGGRRAAPRRRRATADRRRPDRPDPRTWSRCR